MDSKCKQAVIDYAGAEFKGLLAKHIDQINIAMVNMRKEKDPTKAFTYTVGMKLQLTPFMSDETKIEQSCSISYSKRNKDATEPVLIDPSQMTMDFEN